MLRDISWRLLAAAYIASIAGLSKSPKSQPSEPEPVPASTGDQCGISTRSAARRWWTHEPTSGCGKPSKREDAMSDTVTLPAPPGRYFEPGPLPATRHRVLAIGSGLGGLTATKALKHDLANIADAVVFVARLAAQGTTRVVNQPSPWVQVTPPTAAVLTAFGVLITLCIAVAHSRKKAPHKDQNHHATSHSSTYGRLWRSRRTSKGWS